MKLTLIAAVSVLSTLASGLALPDLTPRSTVIRPSIAVVIKEDFPTTSFPTTTPEVSRKNGVHNVKTLLGFSIPACTGTCTFSFSNGLTATGSRTLQLFTSGRYPASGDTWNSHPFTNNQLGTFLVPLGGSGQATVVQDFGLTFPCPTADVKNGYEVQPVNDDDSVTWDIATGGFILTCG